MNKFSKNTFRYFNTIQQHRDGLRRIDEEYAPRLDALEQHKGSEYYKSERKHLTEMRQREVDALRAESTKLLESACDDMERTYLEKPSPVPSAEQLGLVQALKMRDNVSMDELRQAANTVRGVPSLERVLSELATKNGYAMALAPEMSSDEIQNAIHRLRVGGGTMIHRLEHCDDRKRHMDNSDWNMFMYDSDPADEADTLRIFGQITGADAEQFAAAVNSAE
jgi:hypothetical protein